MGRVLAQTVKHVVAVKNNERVKDDTARAFSRHFYTALYQAVSVNTAFRLACTRIAVSLADAPFILLPENDPVHDERLSLNPIPTVPAANIICDDDYVLAQMRPTNNLCLSPSIDRGDEHCQVHDIACNQFINRHTESPTTVAACAASPSMVRDVTSEQPPILYSASDKAQFFSRFSTMVSKSAAMWVGIDDHDCVDAFFYGDRMSSCVPAICHSSGNGSDMTRCFSSYSQSLLSCLETSGGFASNSYLRSQKHTTITQSSQQSLRVCENLLFSVVQPFCQQVSAINKDNNSGISSGNRVIVTICDGNDAKTSPQDYRHSISLSDLLLHQAVTYMQQRSYFTQVLYLDLTAGCEGSDADSNASANANASSGVEDRLLRQCARLFCSNHNSAECSVHSLKELAVRVNAHCRQLQHEADAYARSTSVCDMAGQRESNQLRVLFVLDHCADLIASTTEISRYQENADIGGYLSVKLNPLCALVDTLCQHCPAINFLLRSASHTPLVGKFEYLSKVRDYPTTTGTNCTVSRTYRCVDDTAAALVADIAGVSSHRFREIKEIVVQL